MGAGDTKQQWGRGDLQSMLDIKCMRGGIVARVAYLPCMASLEGARRQDAIMQCFADDRVEPLVEDANTTSIGAQALMHIFANKAQIR